MILWQQNPTAYCSKKEDTMITIKHKINILEKIFIFKPMWSTILKQLKN